MHFAAAIETDSAMNMPSTPATRRRKEPKQVKQSHPLQREEQQISLKKSQQETLRRECASIVLWRRPLQTILFCILELIYLVHHHVNQLISYRKTLCLSSVLLLCSVYFYKTEGAHQTSIHAIESSLFWILYWLGLGIASSIGLGTGLHTFLLYLGPFIARVTLAAYECESVQFPQPPYPKDIICPPANSTLTNGFLATGPVSFWQILWKVKLEAFFWGLGTALGELPPYFMARAARLGQDDNADDEELREFEQLLVNAQLHDRRALTLFERLRYSIYCLIQRIGFWGILLCASIPNPLFDLAGLTCGYFLISFWRFFFATIIGKAVIKMSIQTVFIIFLFSEHHVERIIRWMKHLPYYGRLLQTPFKDWLHEQKGRMHRTSGEQLPAHLTRVSTLSQMFNFFVAAMIGYFIISIINSLAQRYHKRTRSSDCK